MRSVMPQVQHLLQEHFSLPPEKVSPEQALADLGIDSLAAIEFMFQLEDAFGVSLSQERGEMRTVADVAAAVAKARSAQTSAI